MTIIRDSVARTIRHRDYPDHECPEDMEPNGDSRQGWHGKSIEATLLNVTLVPTACGCRVVGTGTLQHPVMIEPCAAHRTDMYPALTP